MSTWDCLTLALGHPLQLDINAFAEHGMMPLARSQQCSRFFRGFGLYPPLLEAGDEEADVECFESRRNFLEEWQVSTWVDQHSEGSACRP